MRKKLPRFTAEKNKVRTSERVSLRFPSRSTFSWKADSGLTTKSYKNIRIDPFQGLQVRQFLAEVLLWPKGSIW